ncbi:MAG: electron transport complex subunit RsxE [Firmicutes bacterium]|nr:electron transport complex subunit RsxE [Bacillota bacterium]
MIRKSRKQIFLDGIIFENPLLVLAMGICPAVSVTARASSGLVMGLSMLFVVLCSNVMISAIKRIIPSRVRIPCYMVIIASFVTIARYLITAYLPAFETSLGVYLPLMVVNCAIFGRAEGFASRNSIINSAVDGLGTGAGYTLALVLMGAVRELAGSGTVFGIPVPTGPVKPITVFLFTPGGLFTLGVLIAIARKLTSKGPAEEQKKICLGCPASAACPMNGKGGCER